MSRALLLSLLLGAAPLAASAETVIITNAKIETAGPAGEIASGVVVVVSGRITAVGAAVPVPAGARIVDAHGGVVTPASRAIGIRVEAGFTP